MATFVTPLAQESSRPRLRPRRHKVQDLAGTVLRPWLRTQSINVTRHAAALRPFTREEFGTGSALPSEGHIQAVNFLITKLRQGLLQMSGNVSKAIAAVSDDLQSSH